MELRTLRYFVAVAEELNITHAAEKLNMSQPPLSNQIKGLEDELGTELFIRGKRHLQLTDAGSVLYRRAREIIDLTEKSAQEITDMSAGMSGTIALGMVDGRAPFYSARWIKGFREEFPLVQYSLWNGSGDDVIERLNKGLLDLAVIAAPYDNEHLEGFEVGREPWVAIIPNSSPLAREPGSFIPLRELIGQPIIVPSRKSRKESIHSWFSEVGAEPNIICEMSNYLDAIALSEQGVGISIFPQTTYTPNDLLVTKVVSEPERQAKYYLVWPKNHRFSAAVEAFLYFVKDLAEEELKNAPVLESVHAPEYIPSEDTILL